MTIQRVWIRLIVIVICLERSLVSQACSFGGKKVSTDCNKIYYFCISSMDITSPQPGKNRGEGSTKVRVEMDTCVTDTREAKLD